MESENEIFEAFKVFDRDGNGLITFEELKYVLESLGETIPENEIHEMIKYASSDASKSYVSLKDFVTIYLVN